MLTTAEYNSVIEFLDRAEEGEFAESENRRVEVANLCGGKFLHYEKESYEDYCGNLHESWAIAGQTNDPVKSAIFLSRGTYFNS